MPSSRDTSPAGARTLKAFGARACAALVAASFAALAPFAVAPLAAETCELGVTPAATLLLPYFEVDPDDVEGTTTLVSVSNALSEPALVNVTFWTDWGVPTFNFPIFLTGYDVATMNIGLALRDGLLPVTADLARDPDDLISPHTFNPDWDGSFDGCENFLALTEPGTATIPDFLREALQRAHSGLPDAAGLGTCSGEDHGDGLLRGYVTMDVVNRCDFLYPSDEGYFADGGTGVAANTNQLFGDYYLIDPTRGFAQGDSLVHIEARGGVGEDGAWQDGDLTFYGRYLDYGAVDNREPLPQVFGARYLGDLGGGGGTELITWRDTGSAEAEAQPCGDRPGWWPLSEREVYDFDEQETAVGACSFWFQTTPDLKLTPPPPIESYACFLIATQRLGIAGDFDEVGNLGYHDAGWLYLDLGTRFGPDRSQAWVSSILSADGQYSVGLPAAALHSSCDGLPTGIQF